MNVNGSASTSCTNRKRSKKFPLLLVTFLNSVQYFGMFPYKSSSSENFVHYLFLVSQFDFISVQLRYYHWCFVVLRDENILV